LPGQRFNFAATNGKPLLHIGRQRHFRLPANHTGGTEQRFEFMRRVRVVLQAFLDSFPGTQTFQGFVKRF
jgi:hypothetical protein